MASDKQSVTIKVKKSHGQTLKYESDEERAKARSRTSCISRFRRIAKEKGVELDEILPEYLKPYAVECKPRYIPKDLEESNDEVNRYLEDVIQLIRTRRYHLYLLPINDNQAPAVHIQDTPPFNEN